MYKVEKNVPIPTHAASRTKYPWPDMEPGDSVAIPLEEGDTMDSLQRRCMNKARAWLNRHKPELKAVTRREKDAVRVWFIEREVAQSPEN